MKKKKKTKSDKKKNPTNVKKQKTAEKLRERPCLYSHQASPVPCLKPASPELLITI